MRLLLACFASLILAVSSGSITAAQSRQPSVLEGGVAKPQEEHPLPLPQDTQARVRFYNQAAMDEVERYNAQQADKGLKTVQADIDQFQRQQWDQAQFNAEFEARNKPVYEAAYQALTEMLDGRRPISLPLAVFIAENTYADNTLNYPAFKAQLDELADRCRTLTGNDTVPEILTVPTLMLARRIG